MQPLDSVGRSGDMQDMNADLLPMLRGGKVSWISRAVLLLAMACTGCSEKNEQPEKESGDAGNGTLVAPHSTEKGKVKTRSEVKIEAMEEISETRLRWEELSSEQQEELIAVTQEYVSNHKVTVAGALGRELKSGSRYVLIGEHHLDELEGQRRAVAASLVTLKEAGLTHVGIETDRSFQDALDTLNIDVDDPERAVEKCLKGIHGRGHAAIVVEAKKLRLRILCIDHTKELDKHHKKYAGAGYIRNPDRSYEAVPYPDGYYRELAGISLRRDEVILKNVEDQLPSDGKILIYIGQAHVHEKPKEIIANVSISRIGTLLAKKYGEKAVVSVRDVLSKRAGFDSEQSYFSRTAPMSKVLTKKELDDEVFMLPDTGPVRGSPRETQTDYLIFGVYKGYNY